MDAFLLLSYGSPERKDDIVPFLRNILTGKNVAQDRIDAVAGKYYEFACRTGSFSPLNDECRALLKGIAEEFGDSGPRCYWGNLFWEPFLDDTVAEMAADGVQRAVCFATSAFDSPAGNQRYTDALEAARRKVGPAAPEIVKLPLPFDHPLFLEAQADRLLSVLAEVALDHPFDAAADKNVLLLFSAHSIPEKDAAESPYREQLQKTCSAVMEQMGADDLSWELVFQSRSGPPSEPWIGPSINKRVREIAAEGRFRTVVVSPIGFFCENFETVRDLDVEIGDLCAELGLVYVRASAVGAAPKICRMIRELCIENG